MSWEKPIVPSAVWKPLKGMEEKFETGNKKHLQWHKDAGDRWIGELVQ